MVQRNTLRMFEKSSVHSGVEEEATSADHRGSLPSAPRAARSRAITTQCDGCPTDSTNPLSTSWPKTSTKCNRNNPNWVSAVMPEAKTAKAACPTAYSFPFDDPTSTFQCSSGSTNTTNYTFTFCP